MLSDIGSQALFYVDELCRIWELTDEQRTIVDLYTAIHTLEFMERLMTERNGVWVEKMAETVEQWIASLEVT